uniref:Uncharacterized protein n=1 Tax=Arundo donax TaxID=35708 RepID=A0A0A9CDM9_ARUDO
MRHQTEPKNLAQLPEIRPRQWQRGPSERHLSLLYEHLIREPPKEYIIESIQVDPTIPHTPSV